MKVRVKSVSFKVVKEDILGWGGYRRTHRYKSGKTLLFFCKIEHHKQGKWEDTEEIQVQAVQERFVHHYVSY